jgi:uncharacterized protein (DUF488 family)
MYFETRKLGGNIDSQKKSIDLLTNFQSKIVIDIDKLEEPLKTVAQYVAQKEKYEFERTAYIKLFELQANALRQLQDTNGRCAILLDHARVHWPGRDTTKSELNKCKSTIFELDAVVNYAKQAISKLTEQTELAQKLIDLEMQITKHGTDRLLMAVESVIKRAAIQRGDIVEVAKALRT